MNRTAPTLDNFHFYDLQPTTADIEQEVLQSLSETPKRLSPKFFYDERGSRLFDAICNLPEYYPTRTEIGILTDHGDEMARHIGRDAALFELGSGNSRKIRLLLSALRPKIYAPMDISQEHLAQSARAIADDYPWLQVHAACVDYSKDWFLPEALQSGRRAAFFPGSSIGNLDRGPAVALMRQILKLVGPEGGFLIGADLKKDPAILEPAYNDAQGVTAEFNKNCLRRINLDLDANFQPDRFRHVAFYSQTRGRIEMHLESLEDQRVQVGGHTFHFDRGERIHTENSYKYDVDEFRQMGEEAGFRPIDVWIDKNRLFSIHYFEPAST